MCRRRGDGMKTRALPRLLIVRIARQEDIAGEEIRHEAVRAGLLEAGAHGKVLSPSIPIVNAGVARVLRSAGPPGGRCPRGLVSPDRRCPPPEADYVMSGRWAGRSEASAGTAWLSLRAERPVAPAPFSCPSRTALPHADRMKCLWLASGAAQQLASSGWPAGATVALRPGRATARSAVGRLAPGPKADCCSSCCCRASPCTLCLAALPPAFALPAAGEG